jgi:hypothetical protein
LKINFAYKFYVCDRIHPQQTAIITLPLQFKTAIAFRRKKIGDRRFVGWVDEEKPNISTHTISPLQNELTSFSFYLLGSLTQPTEFLRNLIAIAVILLIKL